MIELAASRNLLRPRGRLRLRLHAARRARRSRNQPRTGASRQRARRTPRTARQARRSPRTATGHRGRGARRPRARRAVRRARRSKALPKVKLGTARAPPSCAPRSARCSASSAPACATCVAGAVDAGADRGTRAGPLAVASDDAGRGSSRSGRAGLVKRYKEVLAVDHIDLNVRAGDVYGFLGPNGAGKTTTLRMALGLITPTAGQRRAVRARPDARGRARAGGRRRLRRGAALLPVPHRRARTSNCSPRSTADGAARAHRRGARDRRAGAARASTRSAATRTACASGSGSPPRCCAARAC